MMQHTLVNVLAATLLVVTPLLPCAWSDDGDTPDQMISFFDQSIVGDDFFKGLYPRSANPIEYFTDPPRLSDEVALADWKAYLRTAYKVSPSSADIQAALANYTVFARIAKTDDAMKDYIAFMTDVNKALSDYRSRRMQSWQPFTPAEKKTYVDLFAEYAARASQAAGMVKNEFLALRYGFQAVRFSALAERYDDAVSAYNDRVAKRRGNYLIGYQALGYKARALYKKGDRAGALALYLEIFDQCPPLMAQTLQSMYLTATKGEFDAYRASQQNKHKLTTAAFVWAILQKRDYSRETLASILDTNPAGSKPEIVLVRMIQAIEHEMWDNDRHQFTGGGKPKSDHDGIIAFCTEAAARADVRQSALWHTAAAYLLLLSGKPSDAERSLAAAAQVKNVSKPLADQMHCINTLLLLAKDQRTFTADMQNRMADDIRWGERMANSNPRIKDSVITLAAQRYLAANDIARAAAAFSLVSEYTAAFLIDCIAEDNDLFVLEGLLAKRPSGTSLDGYVFSKTAITADDIICSRGMKALRKEDLAQALKHFERLSPAFSKKIVVEYSVDHPPLKNNATHIPSRDKYTAACAVKKTSLAELVKAVMYVQSLADGGKGKLFAPVQFKGDPSLALGNMWFSLFLNADIGTYSGTASRPGIGVQYDSFSPSAASRYYQRAVEKFPLGISGTAERMKRAFDAYERKVDNFKKASRYYAKAMSSKDGESAARACVNTVIAHGLYLHSETKRDAVSREDASALGMLSKFSATKFYKDAIKECPQLGDYR